MKWTVIFLVGAMLAGAIANAKVTVNHTINQCKGQDKAHFPTFDNNPKRIT